MNSMSCGVMFDGCCGLPELMLYFRNRKSEFLHLLYMQVTITRSKKADKKYDAIVDGKKTVSFGAKGYSDYTQHKDKERK